MNITCIWHGNNVLGEGPLWAHREQLFYWLDIEQAQLHQLNPNTGLHQQWLLPDKPGCLALRENGLLIALQKTFIFFDPASGNVTPWIAPLQDQNKIVFNDGKCDRAGRFWLGSKDVKENEPLGALYRLDSDGKFQIMDEGFIVSNGLGWSPDNHYMYFTDGAAHRQILRYDFDLSSGKISNRKIFAKIPEELGVPDGLCVDKEGYVWSAHWDGWRITRYAPDGKIDRVIEMPIPKPTSCCFGGKNLDTLFVTSACRDLTAQQLKQSPLSGSVFSIMTKTAGQTESFFKG